MSADAQDCNLQQIDDNTAGLLIELQLEDAQRLALSLKGKSCEGKPSDVELALEVYIQELGHNASIISDRRMTRSIAQAVQSDGEILRQAMSLEQIAARDWNMAQTLSGNRRSPLVEPLAEMAEELNAETIEKLSALYVSPVEDFNGELHKLPREYVVDTTAEPLSQGESSRWASTRQTSSKQNQCVSCLENKMSAEVVRTPCGHEYCRQCLQDLFRSSMTDESLFPPRCCKTPIYLDSVGMFLTADIVHEYQQKKVEFSTVDKTYCCAPNCSAFIHPDDVDNSQAKCAKCLKLTCTICKSEVHDDDCPADIGLRQLLETAKENGWQRCSSCRRLVELDTGCNHITCTCGNQFCYVCGERWKTCPCDQWDEDRLLARANQVVDRGPQRRGLNLARGAQVEDAVQRLRSRHDCAHDDWRFLKPPRRISAHKFLSLGATGWVYQIDDDIVVKYARAPGSEAFARENEIYDLFEQHDSCPHIIQSFLRVPNANFLPLLSGGSLSARLWANQHRDKRNRFLDVVKTEPLQKVERWTMELSGAVAWLESLGLVHGDLRPENLLLDGEEHLKLVDFDCAEKIGTESSGAPPPWARLLGSEAGSQKGSWGFNGPRTEQFAIGSIIYSMIRGHEPYEDQEQGMDVVRCLQNMEFPELGDGFLDVIIDRCWRGLYQSVGSLAKETAYLGGAVDPPLAKVLGVQYIAGKRAACQLLIDGGLFQETDIK